MYIPMWFIIIIGMTVIFIALQRHQEKNSPEETGQKFMTIRGYIIRGEDDAILNLFKVLSEMRSYYGSHLDCKVSALVDGYDAIEGEIYWGPLVKTNYHQISIVPEIEKLIGSDGYGTDHSMEKISSGEITKTFDRPLLITSFRWQNFVKTLKHYGYDVKVW